MATNWCDIRKLRLTQEQLRRIDAAVARELIRIHKAKKKDK